MKRAIPKGRNSVRAVLRDVTSDTHERMHGLEPFRLIADGALGREAYAGLLTNLFRFHALIGATAREHRLGAFSRAPRKLELLSTDLKTFSKGSPALDRPLDLPSNEHALGALYVAEGSMFGGKVIARQLDYLFGREASGRLFFLGTNDGAFLWQSLVKMLESHAGNRDAVTAMAEGAEMAFRLFESIINLPRDRNLAVKLTLGPEIA